jgi:hypothetical protein
MNWISVHKQLPRPFEVVWIYWRDREILLGCRVYQNDEENSQSSLEGWYSFEDEKCRWTNWWMRVEDSLDKPEPPYFKDKE